MKTIAELNTEAKRINAIIQKEANAEKARQAKRAETLKRRQSAIRAAREQIGTIVRKSYLKNNRIVGPVTQHLTPANARAASVAFMSPAFARAAKNKHNLLKEKAARYQSLWRSWYKSLAPQERIALTRNVYRVIYGNNRWAEDETNPLLFGSRALALPLPNKTKVTTSELARKRPPKPNWNSNTMYTTEYARKLNLLQQKYDYRWMGSRRALYQLSRPEVNAVLRRYGLPFSMTNARRNLLGVMGRNERELNRYIERGGNVRYHIPRKMAFAASM
jgi:hypothetical protein